MGPRFYSFVESYNPRLHFVVFCPQLYKHDRAGRLVPLRAAKIEQFIARALNEKANPRTPWYGLRDEVPDPPILNEALLTEYDSLFADPLWWRRYRRWQSKSHFDMNELERAPTDEDAR